MVSAFSLVASAWVSLGSRKPARGQLPPPAPFLSDTISGGPTAQWGNGHWAFLSKEGMQVSGALSTVHLRGLLLPPW